MIFRFRLASRLRRTFNWPFSRAWRVAGEHCRVR